LRHSGEARVPAREIGRQDSTGCLDPPPGVRTEGVEAGLDARKACIEERSVVGNYVSTAEVRLTTQTGPPRRPNATAGGGFRGHRSLQTVAQGLHQELHGDEGGSSSQHQQGHVEGLGHLQGVLQQALLLGQQQHLGPGHPQPAVPLPAVDEAQFPVGEKPPGAHEKLQPVQQDQPQPVAVRGGQGLGAPFQRDLPQGPQGRRKGLDLLQSGRGQPRPVRQHDHGVVVQAAGVAPVRQVVPLRPQPVDLPQGQFHQAHQAPSRDAGKVRWRHLHQFLGPVPQAHGVDPLVADGKVLLQVREGQAHGAGHPFDRVPHHLSFGARLQHQARPVPTLQALDPAQGSGPHQPASGPDQVGVQTPTLRLGPGPRPLSCPGQPGPARATVDHGQGLLGIPGRGRLRGRQRGGGQRPAPWKAQNLALRLHVPGVDQHTRRNRV